MHISADMRAISGPCSSRCCSWWWVCGWSLGSFTTPEGARRGSCSS